ncbi:MAG: hypothetical protein IT187_02240 [Geothrix sp.]|uniref:Uncharacterized protein n=1 Tax=Candidatus Geothrix odensensis TaxID=2954440 RepID=A0A936F562_9BACT|nr:hypothetical protein [Candidatus Geothrix odensensis]MBK8790006.1 hypothetical protein [Holophagaceae bacterium]MCC6512804.1 hypothetical protein [Geothrix sp.]
MRRLLWVLSFSGAFLLAQANIDPAPKPDAPVVKAPKAEPNLTLGPAVYSTRQVGKIPGSLVFRQDDGKETVIASGPGEPQATSTSQANEFGTFAATQDGKAVLFFSFKTQVVQAAPTVVMVPGAGILAVALGNAIGNAIVAGIAGPPMQYTLVDLSLWDRDTGKCEVLWNAQSLKEATAAWNTAPGLKGMGRRELVSDIQAAGAGVQLFHLKDRVFLLHAGGILAKVDAQARTLTPVWISYVPGRSGERAWRGPEGHLGFVFGDAIAMVEPDGGISVAERNGMSIFPRVVFLNSKSLLATDGKKVHRMEINKDQAEWVAHHEIKNDLLLATSDPKFVLIYRHATFGEDTVSKVGIDGKVAWTTKIGKCQMGLIVGESPEKFYLLVQRSSPSLPFRCVLNAQTGAVLDEVYWTSLMHLGPLAATRVPYVAGGREAWNAATMGSPRLAWFSSEYVDKAPKEALTWSPWVPDPNSATPRIEPAVGMWSVVYPDLTVQPLLGRPLAQRLVSLGNHPQPPAVGEGAKEATTPKAAEAGAPSSLR